MRAVQVSKIGGPEVLEVVDVVVPEPRDGETLIRMVYAPVAFNDYTERTDLFRHPGEPEKQTPFFLGTEGIGVIERINGDAHGMAVGQRVAFVLHGARSYAEYTVAPTERLIPLPDDMPDDAAGAALLSGMTAQMLLHQYRPIGSGTRVLVTGAAGVIGRLLASWAASLGAEVFATVTSQEVVDDVKATGAAYVIDISSEDLVEEVKRHTNGKGVDIAFDGVGGDTWRDVFETLGVRGIGVAYGITGGLYPLVDPLTLVDRSRSVASLLFFNFVETRDDLLAVAEDVIGAYRRGAIKPAIRTVLPLEEAPEAHRLLRTRGRGGKILLLAVDS
ncbi:zinc-binding dehydrogenase [Kribbella sp. VKM Ac-2566]|uniref:zinc-binding dehydrogenase n=1 Tax=Kribbella sp. VKM Ac-2566 TaxID=2512218 RepID=UPI0010CFA610|nr:zinc-binding dehydrogenase [Kribbella sp. VKM Ac-2566]TDX08275.1 NADPH2:quinone reductase [Kribbella sp. VKM Ac-2566]